MRIGGADPGRKGVLLVLDTEHEHGWFWRLRYNKAGHLDLHSALLFLETTLPKLLVMEKVQGRQGFGATQTFNFGHATGELNAMLRYWADVKTMALHYVSPQRWQKDLHEGISDKLKPKERSALAYQRLFPHDPAGSAKGGKAGKEGVIDAMLLAVHGVLRFGGGQLRGWQLGEFVSAEPVVTGVADVVPLERRKR